MVIDGNNRYHAEFATEAAVNSTRRNDVYSEFYMRDEFVQCSRIGIVPMPVCDIHSRYVTLVWVQKGVCKFDSIRSSGRLRRL